LKGGREKKRERITADMLVPRFMSSAVHLESPLRGD
jgi:hypothetical protein